MAENKLKEQVGLTDILRARTGDIEEAAAFLRHASYDLSRYREKLGQFQPHTKIDVICSCGHEYKVSLSENLTFNLRGVNTSYFFFDDYENRVKGGLVPTYGITESVEMIVFNGVCPNCNHQEPVLYELTGRTNRTKEFFRDGSEGGFGE